MAHDVPTRRTPTKGHDRCPADDEPLTGLGDSLMMPAIVLRPMSPQTFFPFKGRAPEEGARFGEKR